MKSFKKGFKNRTTLGAAIIAPVVAMIILSYLISIMVAVEPAQIGIVNLDKGMGNVSASKTIIDELGNQDNITLIYLGSQSEIDTNMKEKKIDGALVFDENFTSNLVLNKTADINIFLEGTDQAKSVLITKSVSNAYLTVAKNQQGNNGTSIEVNSQDVYGTDMDTEDMIMTSIIALITLILTSIISTVTMVNLRRKKTFKSMINSPIKATLACTIGNYLFSIITALIVFFYALYILNITMEGSVINSLLLTLFIALIGTSIGVFVTAITRKDSQAFGLLIPIIILQYLFGGNIVAVSKFDIYVQYFSYLLPMTYSLDAMKSLVIRNYSWGDVWIDLVALLIILILLFTFSVVGLKYQSRSQQTNE